MPGFWRAPLVLHLAVEKLLHGELVAADPVRYRGRAQVHHGAAPRRLGRGFDSVDTLALKARLVDAVRHPVWGDSVRLVEEPWILEQERNRIYSYGL